MSNFNTNMGLIINFNEIQIKFSNKFIPLLEKSGVQGHVALPLCTTH